MKKALLVAPAVAYLLYRLNAKTSTKKIKGENAVSEMRMIPVNGTELAVMIRGTDRDNPVLLCVSGGPAATEIPYMKKYERKMEERFTIVHYDQRGSGKSYSFTEDYSGLDYHKHVDDLIALTEYIREYLNKDKIYILGHSYGSYLGFQAVDRKPEYYKAYIGVGQVSDMTKSENYILETCIEAAREKGDEKDVKELESLKEKVRSGESLCPRKYVRKYKFNEREEHHELRDLLLTVAFGKEYNIMDAVKAVIASKKYSYPLAMEALGNPLTEIVKEVKIPSYFLLGKYDGMTSPKAAKEYFDSLDGDAKKEFVIFDNSAHSPQIEENEAFVSWMFDVLLQENEKE